MNENFSTRLNYAIQCIKKGCTGGRTFDYCFEMYDGDYIVTAIIRRSIKDNELKEGLLKFLGKDWYIRWIDIADKYIRFSDKELKVEANKYRMTKFQENEEREERYQEQTEKARILLESGECKHPPHRIYFWFAYNHETGKKDIPCAGCCDCGKTLLGMVE